MFVDIIEILLRGLCVGVASSITVGPVAVLCIGVSLWETLSAQPDFL